MQKLAFLSIITLSSFFLASFQTKKKKEELNWLTLEQVETKLKEQPRPVLIDLYTDWCGWCKVMDKKTYTNQQLIQYLNEKFYVVKLNAETKQELSWKGKTYTFNPQYKTNEIALYFTGGQLAYPTTVIIPVGDATPQPIPGMIEIKDMEIITTYFGENQFGKKPFNSYARSYKRQWH